MSSTTCRHTVPFVQSWAHDTEFRERARVATSNNLSCRWWRILDCHHLPPDYFGWFLKCMLVVGLYAGDAPEVQSAASRTREMPPEPRHNRRRRCPPPGTEDNTPSPFAAAAPAPAVQRFSFPPQPNLSHPPERVLPRWLDAGPNPAPARVRRCPTVALIPMLMYRAVYPDNPLGELSRRRGPPRTRDRQVNAGERVGGGFISSKFTFSNTSSRA